MATLACLCQPRNPRKRTANQGVNLVPVRPLADRALDQSAQVEVAHDALHDLQAVE